VLRIVKSYVTTGIVPNCVNRAQTSHAKALLSVRHRNLPGVLAHVFESISLAGVNVEEMENIIYEGASAACARIQLDDQPTPEQIATIRENENILGVIVSIIN
jgi:D-3-phosphoglycerate dehydrogenase